MDDNATIVIEGGSPEQRQRLRRQIAELLEGEHEILLRQALDPEQRREPVAELFAALEACEQATMLLAALGEQAEPGVARAEGVLERQLRRMRQQLERWEAQQASTAQQADSTEPAVSQENAELAPDPSPGQASSAQPPLVMVVEDHDGAARMMLGLLKLWGYRGVHAREGSQALAMLEELDVEGVVCDLSLPGMDGHAFARAVRQEKDYQQLALIALTGDDRAGVYQRSIEAGFDEHFLKPVPFERLRETLEAMVGSPAQEDAR